MQPLFSPHVTIILLFILALVSFFFSASETSIIGLSKIRLRHMLSRGVKRSKSIQRLMQKMDKFIVAILVGNNFVNIAMSAIVTGTCVYIFGYKGGIIIATLATAFFIVLICEITPKILAIKHTERVALFIAPLMAGTRQIGVLYADSRLSGRALKHEQFVAFQRFTQLTGRCLEALARK